MPDFHHSALAAHPDDSAARLLLAEHLDERGDPDAAGYRWMAERGKRPWLSRFKLGWRWYSYRSSVTTRHDPPEAVTDTILWQMCRCCNNHYYSTRRDAEIALCRAVTKLQGTELTNEGGGYADVIS